jgi:hypothetical protein
MARMKQAKPIDPAIKASVVKTTMDHTPELPTFGGLFGQWTVEGRDKDGKLVFGMMAGHGQCLRHAAKYGVAVGKIDYTEAALKRIGVKPRN